MHSSDIITALQLAFTAAVLVRASHLDLRTRRVPNAYWVVLSLAGIGVMGAHLVVDDAPLEYLLVLVPIFAVLSDVFWDHEGESALARGAPLMKYSVAVTSVVLLLFLWYDDTYFQHLIAVPILMLAIIVMYMFDVIRGGADAKALIALSIMFPFYPVISSLPVLSIGTDAVQVLFPFAFSVLINAAILVVFLPVLFLLRNVAKRDVRFPQMALGYRMEIDRAGRSFVWLMETVDNGSLVYRSRPKRHEDMKGELDKLRAHGLERVWVTPKIPFIIPISASFLFTVVVGNLLFPVFGF